MSVDNIKVAIKARPLLKREKDNKLSCQWKIKNNSIQLLERETEPFHFDHIFDENTTNQELFELIAKPIVDATLKGFNGTIFAYGQTSSGKTYTMIGDDDNVGVIDLATKEIFKEIQAATDRAFLLRVGYIEIYNEKIYDLLDKKNDLKIHETVNGEVNVNCTEFIITCEAQIMEFLHAGNKSRKIGETNMNERSSRSHAIFRIIIESREINKTMEDDAVQISYLNLVDLAGSERADQTGATGSRLKEGGHINKSLLSLSLVIKQLSENESDKFINYRNSKLTRILQASLGGNALTAIICTITPTAIEETYSTLSFALRAKSIKNKPKVNEILSDAAMMKKLEKEIVRLQKELESERQRIGHIKALELENKIKEQELKFIRSNYAVVKTKDRRKTWCPMSTITEENPKLLCAQRRESFVSPSKPPIFLTPMVNTQRGFIDETPPFSNNLTPDGEIFQPPGVETVFNNDVCRMCITPERDLERKCKQLEQELEELKAFTDVERKLELTYDTAIMLDEKSKELQREKVLYEEKRFQLKLLQEQMEEKNVEYEEYKNRCKILESVMSKLEEQVKILNSKESDYKRQLEELQQKNKNLTDLAKDAESFKFMFEEKLKRAKVRENDLLVLMGEKDAQISNMERNAAFSKKNVLIDKSIATEITFNGNSDFCFCGLHETHSKLSEDFKKISEENQILQRKIISLENVDTENASLKKEFENLKQSLKESDKKIEKLQKDLEGYRSKTVTLQNEYDQISNELMEAIQDCEDFKSKCSEYESKTTNFEEMKKSLEEKNEELEKSYDSVYKFLTDLNSALDNLENADFDKNAITSFIRGDFHSDTILAKIQSLKSNLISNCETLRAENQSLHMDKTALNNCLESLNQKHSKKLEELHSHVSKLACAISEPDLDHELTSEYLAHLIESAISKINLSNGRSGEFESNATQTLVSEQDNQQFQKELDVLYEQTEQLGSSLTELCGSQMNYLDKIKYLENYLSEQLKVKESEVKKLLEENLKLNNRLDSEKSNLESEISKLNKENRNLHSSIDAAEQRLLDEQQNKNDVCNRLYEIICDLETRIEDVATDYKKIDEQKRSESEDRSSIQSMQKEMETHALREADLERDLEYIKGKCFQLEEELKFTLTSRDEVIAANKCFEQQVLELNNFVEQKTCECQQLQKKCSETESFIFTLETEVTISKEKYNKIELEKKELGELLKSKTLELEKLTENLSVKCKELCELEEKCSSLNTRICDLLKEKDEVMQEKHALLIEHNSLKHTLDEIQNEKEEFDEKQQPQFTSFNLEKEFEDLKNKFSKQNAELEELKAKYNDDTLNRSETFSHSDALVDALEEKDSTISENKKLVEQVEEAVENQKLRHSNEIRDMKAKHCEELEICSKNLKELEELKELALQENQKQKEDIKEFQISLSNKTKELAELQSLYDETSSNIGIMGQKLEEKSSELLELKNCISELTVQLNEVKMKYEKDSNEKYDSVNKQLNELMTQKESALHENCKLMEEAKQMKEMMAELTENCKNITASYEDSCKKVETYAQENVKLTQEIEQMTKSVEEITDKFKNLNDKYKDECQKTKGYEQEVVKQDEAILENLKLAEEIREMRKVVEDLTNKLTELNAVYESECCKLKLYEQQVLDKSDEILRLKSILAETNDELVKRTEIVQQKNVELLQKVKNLEDDILKREEEVMQLQTQYEEVCKKLSDKENELLMSVKQFDGVNAEYEQLKVAHDKVCAEEKTYKDELKIKIEELSKTEVDYQTKQKELNSKIQELEQCLSSEKEHLCKLASEHETELEQKMKIISELTDKYNILDNKFNLVLEEKKKMSDTIKELTEDLEVWKSNNETTNSELEALRKKYDEANNKVESIVNQELVTQKKFEDLSEKLRLMSEDHQKLESENKTLTLSLVASEEASNTLKAKHTQDLEELKNEIKNQNLQAAEQLNKICLEKQDLLSGMEQMKLCITEKSKEYSELERTYNLMLQKVTNAEEQLSTKCRELLELEGNYKSLSDQLEAALTEKQYTSSSNLKLQEQVQHLTKQLEEVKIQLGEKYNTIESNYYGEMEALKVKHAEELQNLKENCATEINSLHTKYQEDIIGLKSTHDKEFTALKHKHEEICILNNNLNEQVSQLSSQINELKEKLQNVTTQKNIFETENKNYMFLQSKLQNENIKLCEEVRLVNEKNDDLNKKFEMCMQTLKQNESEKLKLEEKVRYLTEKNIEFAKKIEVLNDEKTKIGVKLNTHLNTMQFDLTRCQAEKKNLENNILEFDIKLRQNESQNLLLSNKIEALELEKIEMKKVLDDKVKQLTNVTNASLGKYKSDNSHSSPDRCSTSTSRSGDSHLSKSKSSSPTSEEIRRSSLIDRKTKRRSKHDEKRQSLWENTRDMSTMTMPTTNLCNCEELNTKVTELKRAIRIKECQINTLMFEAQHNSLKEENKELQKRISIEEAEKHNLKAEIFKLKARPITIKENNCTMCANKSSSTHTNKLCQTDKVYITHSNHMEEISDLKEKCDTLLGEISKLKINNEDLKKVCRLRLSRIHELEGKCKNEKENECLNHDPSTSNQISTLKASIEALKKDLHYVSKKYQICKTLCVSRAEKISALEKKIEEKGAS